MSTEASPQEQYPLDLPEDVLLTNMLAYHAHNLRRYSGTIACSAQIVYDGPEPDSTLSFYSQDIPRQSRKMFGRRQQPALAAYRTKPVLHPPKGFDNITVDGYSFNDVDILRPGTEVPGSGDVPNGLYVLNRTAMLKVGRPDLFKEERHYLHSTIYAPYVGQFVLRQDTFTDGEDVFKRAVIALTKEVKNLHDHIAESHCVCKLLVRNNHFGTVAEYIESNGIKLNKR